MSYLTSLTLDEAPLGFLDVETTGLRPDLGDRVVEIAIVRALGPTEVTRFVSLVNPQRFANRLRQQGRPLVADWHRMQGGQVWRPSR